MTFFQDTEVESGSLDLEEIMRESGITLQVGSGTSTLLSLTATTGTVSNKPGASGPVATSSKSINKNKKQLP